jgi:hypothetical protein
VKEIIVSKILDAQDILSRARHCLECVYAAAAQIEDEQLLNAIQTVITLADEKIIEASDLLQEYRVDIGQGPVDFAKEAIQSIDNADIIEKTEMAA